MYVISTSLPPAHLDDGPAAGALKLTHPPSLRPSFTSQVHAVTPTEQAFTSVLILLNVLLAAYIVGTITNIVVRQDEQTRENREQRSKLKAYVDKHPVLSKDLRDSMEEHLQSYLNEKTTTDESVLSIYPNAVRRKVLQAIYLSTLKASSLFKGATNQMLDVVLSFVKLETFNLGDEIVSVGDYVQEFYVVVEGRARVVERSNEGANVDPISSQLLFKGQMFGEASFFTESESEAAVIASAAVCSVLVMTRAAWINISRDHPGLANLMLQNLRQQCEERVAGELAKLKISNVSKLTDAAYDKILRLKGRLSGRQLEVIKTAVSIRNRVRQQESRIKEAQIFEFLAAASRNDILTVKRMLEQGHRIKEHDYDKRTALHVASGQGDADMIRLLLDAG